MVLQKQKYIKSGNSGKWKSFFHDTPFQVCGYLEEARGTEERQTPRESTPAPTNTLHKDKTMENLTPTPESPKNPQANPSPNLRTSDGIGDYPPPTNPTAKVNESYKQTKTSSVYTIKMLGVFAMRKIWSTCPESWRRRTSRPIY